MAASSDITVVQNGRQGNVKLHPYFITLLRWCLSCLWSTATVFLHRLMTAQLPQITAKPSKNTMKPRRAGTDHLHPEPRVECMVLHQPPSHTMDVIFVHGLYGSLGNTWRQGDWSSKYTIPPKKVPLRKHGNIRTCDCSKDDIPLDSVIHNDNDISHNYNEFSDNDIEYNDNHNEYDDNEHENEYNELFEFGSRMNDSEVLKDLNEKLLKKILPQENNLITEQFYNNTLLDQVEIVDNYETQAKFVQDLFKSENCDNICSCEDNCYDNHNENSDKIYNDNEFSDNINDNMKNECACNVKEKNCEVGCGCICDDCYSTCWPRDWIKEDFPGARVISINYTSDPYLWRPLWIKENKRMRLHERAEQMIQQLIEMGVGEKPIVWVGHSKGGLFIKQIYCEAYEAHKTMNKNEQSQNGNEEILVTDEHGNIYHVLNDTNNTKDNITLNDNKLIQDNPDLVFDSESKTDLCSNVRTSNSDSTDNCLDCKYNDVNVNECKFRTNINLDSNEVNEVISLEVSNQDVIETGRRNSDCSDNVSSNIQDITTLNSRASLWSNSIAFMFYSVPHRGSPLADFKTPITSRSIELLEISKDCSLVVSLQSRWLSATAPARPLVRGLVETCRTLMSILWLRIVSVDSADAGIGSLSGVSVDHREICKPSGRACLLYTELTDLIRAALNRCDCQ